VERTAKTNYLRNHSGPYFLFLGGLCTGGSSDSKDNLVAASVNGKNLMLADVERGVSQQSGGDQSKLSQLELAQARLQVLGNLIQREVLFQRAEREKVLPTEDQITAIINQQKQQSNMTDDDFQKSLAAQHRPWKVCVKSAVRTLPSRIFRTNTAPNCGER